jgi:hypothetical protein
MLLNYAPMINIHYMLYSCTGLHFEKCDIYSDRRLVAV